MPAPKSRKTHRSREIARDFFDLLARHVSEVVDGHAEDFMKIDQIAGELFVSHKHLTDTIQRETGHHPCHFYDLQIIGQARQLLRRPDLSVAEVAKKLTYDPSNFSKFFKKFTGQTPGEFRKTMQKPAV